MTAGSAKEKEYVTETDLASRGTGYGMRGNVLSRRDDTDGAANAAAIANSRAMAITAISKNALTETETAERRARD